MIGWLVTAAVLGLLLSAKVGVNLKWENGTALLKVRVGFLRFSLSTNKRTKRSRNKKNGDNQTIKKEAKEKKPAMKKWARAFLLRWRDVLLLLGKILRSPQLELLRLRITVGNKDPEKCAMQYGKLCAGLSAGLPFVEQQFSIRKKDIDVNCNFALLKNEIYAETEATVRIYEVLAIAVGVLLLLVRIYRDVKNNEKAVGF